MSVRRQRNLARFIEKHFPDAEEHNRGTGTEYRFVCPFCKGGRHNEVSFDVNIDKGVTRCWRATCGYKGSAGWFLKDFLDVSYPEAERILKGESEVSLSDLKADSVLLYEEVKKRYSSVDLSLLGRKIDEWVDGAEPVGWSAGLDDVLYWLEEDRGYEPYEFLDQHSLYYPPQEGRWSGRVLFEVRSLINRAYLAYAYYPDMKPKTLNPPGAVLSKMLYNYDDAFSGDTVFICEGIFDSARLKSWGLHAVSVFGVALSPDQVYLLSKMKAKELCILLDHGAEEAALGMCETLSEYIKNKDITICQIEREKADPDDLEPDEFMEYFDKRKRRANRLDDQLVARMAKLKKML